MNPGVCSVCTHPRLETIDSEIVEGPGSERTIAGRFGLTKSIVNRHKAHIAALMAKTEAVQELAKANDLVGKLAAIASEARRLAKKAEKRGDIRGALAGLRELARVAELEARAAGQIRDGGTTVVNFNVADPEAVLRMAAAELARRGWLVRPPGSLPLPDRGVVETVPCRRRSRPPSLLQRPNDRSPRPVRPGRRPRQPGDVHRRAVAGAQGGEAPGDRRRRARGRRTGRAPPAGDRDAARAREEHDRIAVLSPPGSSAGIRIGT
jgi:hypothetical protein